MFLDLWGHNPRARSQQCNGEKSDLLDQSKSEVQKEGTPEPTTSVHVEEENYWDMLTSKDKLSRWVESEIARL